MFHEIVLKDFIRIAPIYVVCVGKIAHGIIELGTIFNECNGAVTISNEERLFTGYVRLENKYFLEKN